MKPFISLIAAIMACAGIIHGGAIAAEAMVSSLPPETQQNGALVETLFTIFIFGPLLIAALLGGAATGINPLHLGHSPLKLAALGASVGALGLSGAAGYAWLSGSLAPGGETSGGGTLLLIGTALVLLQAGSEEVYFRGWLQPMVAARWGTVPAILVSTLAFATLHLLGGARSPLTLINLLLGGLMFGVLAAYGRGIAAPLAAHFAWNWTELILLGLLPNPGTGGFGAFVDLDLVGSIFWGGGEEGLNASIPMTLTLLALLIPLALLARAGRKRVSGPAET